MLDGENECRKDQVLFIYLFCPSTVSTNSAHKLQVYEENEVRSVSHFVLHAEKERKEKEILDQSQRAPASLSRGTRVPLIWEAITPSIPPTSLPPTNTRGRAELPPSSHTNALSSSLPLGYSSSSYTVEFTPMPNSSRFTAWQRQQELRLNITTAFALTILTIRSTGSPARLYPRILDRNTYLPLESIYLEIDMIYYALRLCVHIYIKREIDWRRR